METRAPMTSTDQGAHGLRRFALAFRRDAPRGPRPGGFVPADDFQGHGHAAEALREAGISTSLPRTAAGIGAADWTSDTVVSGRQGRSSSVTSPPAGSFGDDGERRTPLS